MKLADLLKGAPEGADFEPQRLEDVLAMTANPVLARQVAMQRAANPREDVTDIAGYGPTWGEYWANFKRNLAEQFPTPGATDHASVSKLLGLLGITAYHGSPHKFTKFDMSKVGTGEGAQAYGHGLYFAESPGVAQSYQHGLAKPDFTRTADGVAMRGRLPEMLQEAFDQVVAQQGQRMMVSPRDAVGVVSKNLDRQRADALKANDMDWYGKVADMQADLARFQERPAKPVGSLYKVDIPDEAVGKMLDWDKPLSQQPESVRQALERAYPGSLEKYGDRTLQAMFPYGGVNKAVAENLRAVGIPGIKYLDQGSRTGGKGTSNFVVFDDQLPKILGRE